MRFVNWDDRPAVLGSTEAFAMLKPGSDWVEVDHWDVFHTAGVMDEPDWRERFKRFGRLDPPKLDQSIGERADASASE